MKLIRIIPSLLISDNELYKGTNFVDHSYVGDVFNAVKIFSEKSVHEIIILDIQASAKNKSPNINLIKKIKEEIFVPLTVGGGIKTLDDASVLIQNGVEKVSINTEYYNNRTLITDIANKFGSQSVVVSIDVKLIDGKYKIFSENGTNKINLELDKLIKQVQEDGAGEIILTSIDNEGKRNGFDLELYKKVDKLVNIPIIAHGGAGTTNDFLKLFDSTNIASAAAGATFVYFGSRRAVLINYPSEIEIENIMKRYE